MMLLLAGCFLPRPVPKPLPANPDYGAAPPANYKDMIQSKLDKSFFSNILFGSKNSTYDFFPPVKGHTDANLIIGARQTFGWVVCGTLYRQEKYAGYPTFDGPIPFYVLFKDGKIVEQLVGQTTANHTIPHSINDDVKKVCSRVDK